MKTTVNLIFVALLLLFATNVLFAQQSEIEFQKDASAKAIKPARRGAKQLEKQGYSTFPGVLPLDKQIEKRLRMESEINDEGGKKYYWGSGVGVAEIFDVAYDIAIESAKVALAERLILEIANRISFQLNIEDAMKIYNEFNKQIALEIGTVQPIVQMNKMTGKNFEAIVCIAYEFDKAVEVFKKILQKSLDEETRISEEKLDSLIKK